MTLQEFNNLNHIEKESKILKACDHQIEKFITKNGLIICWYYLHGFYAEYIFDESGLKAECLIVAYESLEDSSIWKDKYTDVQINEW
jgi:hypothetical protein